MIRFKNIDIKVPLTMSLLALFYFFMLFYQARQVAITDDARFYMSAAKSYSNYFENCDLSKRCFEQATIDKYWSDNHEHPPFAKLLMAGGYFVFYKKFKMLDEIRALRIGISIFAVVLLMFIFSFTRRAFSFNAAVFASLFFIFLPRTFFHARVATLDFAVAGTSFIFVYCYWRGFTSKFFAWMTGIAFGVALATKLNAPFMVLPVLIHYFYVKRDSLRKSPVRTIFAPQFISMLLFSIPVFFMMWPWLWHVTVKRFIEYVMFHTNHYGILMYYLGNIYSTPRPPWHGPLVMMILTTPVMALLFAAVSPMLYKWKDESDRFSPMLLVILSAVVSISALMFLPAPYYSGVKLFQPFFPFMAIIAGTGLYFVLKGATIIPERYKFAPAVLMFIPVIFSMIDLKNDTLSYYNELAGGTKGSSAYGNEQQYYDLFYYELTEFFNKECAKKVCRVSFEPNAKEYDPSSNILKKAGYLTNNFRFSNSGRADYFVLTHEYRWRQYPFILRNSKKLEKVYTIERQGVDLVTVFKLNE